MANKKITELTSLDPIDVTSSDLLVIVNGEGANIETKKITVGDFFNMSSLDTDVSFVGNSLNIQANTGQISINGDPIGDYELSVTGSIFATGDIIAYGNVQIGNSTTDNLVIGADLSSDIIPNTANTYNIGSDSKYWYEIYTKNLFVKGDFDVVGDSSLHGELVVDKDLTVGSDLLVDTTNNFVNVSGLRVGSTASDPGLNNLYVEGDSNIIGDLVVSSNTSITGSLDVVDSTSIHGVFSSDGNATFSSNVNIDGTLTTGGNATFSSGVDVSGTLDVLDNATFSHTVGVSGNVSIGMDLDVLGNLGVNNISANNITSSGDATVAGTLTVSGITSDSIAVLDSLKIGTGISDPDTGSINVKNNATISGDIWIGGNVTVMGTGTGFYTTVATTSDSYFVSRYDANTAGPGGLIVHSGAGLGNDRTFKWDYANLRWNLDWDSYINGSLIAKDSIDIQGATSGVISLVPVPVAGTQTITLPATTGTLITTGDIDTVTSTMIYDGTGSGLDSDKLDGQHGTYYAVASTTTAHISNTSNPHSVTASQVGLGNVTNESKATMFTSPTFTGTVSGITATTVGLGNVTNESKATMFTSPVFTGTVSGVTASMVGLGNVTNESKATMFTSPVFTGTVSGVTASMVGLGNVTNESKATMFTSPTFTGTVSGVTATHVGLGNVTNESKATMFTSPTFTGTPIAPTANTSSNNTQIATTEFVRAVINTEGVGGATLINDTSTDRTQYLGMSTALTGTWSTAYVASTELYFNPSTGTLNSTVFNTLSDQSEKENIQNISNALDVVNDLRGVTFDWKSNGLKSSGIIAQELERILPFLVTSNVEGVKSVNYNGIIGYLIEAVKDLSKELEILKNRQ